MKHASTHNKRKSSPKTYQKPSSAELLESKDSSSVLLSRRGFLYGALGLGGLCAVGGTLAATGAFASPTDDEITYLEVPEDCVTPLTDFESIDDYKDILTLKATYDIDYGTLIWVNDDALAACLLPTETGSPLTQVGLLYLESGQLDKVIENPIGKNDGFEIYDVRATSTGVIWTEANIMQGAWRIYSAALSQGALGTPQLLDEGGRDFETPTLGAVDSYCFWQRIPTEDSEDENPTSLFRAPFGQNSIECLYKSYGRSATPIYSADDSVIISPLVSENANNFQITRINARTGEVEDTLVLPPSMTPLEAAWGKTGFMFSFPDIYNYGEGISNLGTYVPFEKPEDGNYSFIPWFDFARTPTAPPAWSDNLLIVKSTYSVCGVDLDNRSYFAIEVENGADSYGEYLATSGSRSNFVTYTNVDHTPIGEQTIHACRVKIWTPTNGMVSSAIA